MCLADPRPQSRSISCLAVLGPEHGSWRLQTIRLTSIGGQETSGRRAYPRLLPWEQPRHAVDACRGERQVGYRRWSCG
jgi:hypothetical protein